MKFGFGIFRRVDQWPQRWRRPASTLSRALRPLITYWMRKKRKKIASAPKIAGQTPVVCIGNLVVGGSGKSPLVMGLALRLKDAGFRPGIVSRGFGGFVSNLPIEVTENSEPHIVGDEPLMLKIRTGCPVIVCRDRAKAVDRLCFHHRVDVVLADDGLQNTQLWRDLSVCVFNKQQGIGNGLEMPFGPLREPLTVVDQLDAVVVRETEYPKEMLIAMGVETTTPVFASMSRMAYAYRSDSPNAHHPITDLIEHGDFDAISGIASPGRFFEGLEQAGLSIKEHAFPDHHQFTVADISELKRVITTEKDAVKLVHLLAEPFWVVALDSDQFEFERWIIDHLKDWSRV
ncbi:MAG: tetraacyldisaccharide 4'-kinase [Pseudomonadota bacterium]|nr:tetraacyldisaccharide 4'-kinase [Pseudomonadota bacterium]MEE2820937.1 tetraacyldisaccharide 4'-kinase [Pseudomonadota bacterium]